MRKQTQTASPESNLGESQSPKREQVDAYRVGRNFIRVGDVVKVRPSRPGKHDGFRGKVRAIFQEGDAVTRVDVWGGANGGASLRSFTPDRLTRVAQSRLKG